MSNPNDYESRLWNLLETKRLADLSQYHRPNFLDEVPLYTRESDIDFLPSDPAEANLILLRFSLKFLKSVVAYESHRSGYLAAITVSDFDDTRIVPCLFIWNASLRKIRSQVRLEPASSLFGKQIKRQVASLKLRNDIEVLEDTVPGTIRAFLSLAKAPYPGFVTLDQLLMSARVAT